MPRMAGAAAASSGVMLKPSRPDNAFPMELTPGPSTLVSKDADASVDPPCPMSRPSRLVPVSSGSSRMIESRPLMV